MTHLIKSTTLIVMIAILFASCTGTEISQEEARAYPVVEVESRDILAYQTYPTSIQGINNNDVRAKIQGYISEVLVDEGQRVSKGQIMFRLETNALSQNASAAKSGVAAAQARVESAQVDVNKLQPLVHQNIVSPVLLETAKLNLLQAISVPYQLLSNRPDVRAAEYNLINAFQMVNVAKANFYPSFRLTANSGFQSIDIDQLFSPKAIFSNVITSLTQPIWNKRGLKTQHEISLARQQIAYLNYRKSILNAGKKVSDALSNFKSQHQIEEFKIKEYEAYRTATQYSLQLMNHGLANYLEVLRAQENELSTQISILDAKYIKLNSIVQLYKALGGGLAD